MAQKIKSRFLARKFQRFDIIWNVFFKNIIWILVPKNHKCLKVFFFFFSKLKFWNFFHFFINNFSPNWNLIWFKKLRILSWKLDIKKLIEILGFLDKNSTFWNRVLLRGCIKSEKHLPPGNLPRKPNAEIMGLSGSWAVTETRTKNFSKKWSALHCPKNQLGLCTVACLCFRERLVFTLSQ